MEMINANLASRSKGNNFCEGPRKSGGACRSWRCMKMDIKTGQENRYPPTAYTRSTCKNSCTSVRVQGHWESARIHPQFPHIIIYSVFTCLGQNLTRTTASLPSFTPLVLDVASVSRCDCASHQTGLLFAVWCQRHSQPQAATDEAPPQASQKLATWATFFRSDGFCRFSLMRRKLR